MCTNVYVCTRSSYLQARLTWKWRYKLTNHVHDAYFQNKAYYFIGEGGGVKGGSLSLSLSDSVYLPLSLSLTLCISLSLSLSLSL